MGRGGKVMPVISRVRTTDWYTKASEIDGMYSTLVRFAVVPQDLELELGPEPGPVGPLP